jgi:hypothetical protein
MSTSQPYALPSSLCSLANVEQQLIMQHSDLTSLYALARCSKQLYNSASLRFAWKYAPREFFEAPIEPEFYQHFSTSLQGRFGGKCTHLRWRMFSEVRGRNAVDAMLAVLSVTSIHSLDATVADRVLADVDWQRLLTHPSVQDLRVLRTSHRNCESPGLPSYVLSLIAQLPDSSELPHLHLHCIAHVSLIRSTCISRFHRYLACAL